MQQRVKVLSQGRITLPVAIRRKLGIESGDTLLVKERPEGILLRLRPSGFHRYTDAEIAEWVAADRLEDRERRRLLGRLTD